MLCSTDRVRHFLPSWCDHICVTRFFLYCRFSLDFPDRSRQGPDLVFRLHRKDQGDFSKGRSENTCSSRSCKAWNESEAGSVRSGGMIKIKEQLNARASVKFSVQVFHTFRRRDHRNVGSQGSVVFPRIEDHTGGGVRAAGTGDSFPTADYFPRVAVFNWTWFDSHEGMIAENSIECKKENAKYCRPKRHDQKTQKCGSKIRVHGKSLYDGW